MSYLYDSYGWLIRAEYERRCREYFARFIGGAEPLNQWWSAKSGHTQEPRCPAYWRGSDRRWG